MHSQSQQDAGWPDYVKAGLLYCLPHHLISRAIYFVTRIKSPLKNPFIRWFIRKYQVDMSEAAEMMPEDYPTFNAFFTRALKPECRPVAEEANIIASPVDGCVSQAGSIDHEQLIQAKGHSYTVQDLLGGQQSMASEFLPSEFLHGTFATLYLSPKDYHRIHMPCDGQLKQMVYVPGRLYSVAPYTTHTIKKLFTRNERVITIFEGEFGIFAMILVGAINVAAIETVWHGLITPPHRGKTSDYLYTDNSIHLKKGQEMGRFNMGSTVIILANNKIEWLPQFQSGFGIKMGQAIGTIAK